MRFRDVTKPKQPTELPMKIASGRTAKEVFDHIQIDHCNLLSKTKYKYVLCILDEYSQYTWIRPTISTSADEVVSFLRELTLVHGPFKRITSDRGSAFTSELMKQYCKLTGTKHYHDSSFTPSSSGL